MGYKILKDWDVLDNEIKLPLSVNLFYSTK